MKPKLITCNYTNLYGTKLNGRLNRDDVYKFSLRGIAESGAQIVNYTCPYNLAITGPYFTEQKLTNVTSIDYDLTTSPYYEREMAIKDIEPKYYQDTSWGNRCIEIMWGKFLWLEENFKNLNDDDYLFWIDAGLSHGGIIPKKYNTFEGKIEYGKPHKPEELLLEYAHRHDLIFNEQFIPSLEKYAGDKVFVICANHNQHGDALGFDFFNDLGLYPIGGLFGGKKKVMLPVIQRFKELADIILESKRLVKEEQIMAVILVEHPEWFKTFKFETWYHPDWNCYNPKLIPFAAVFEELLKI